MSLTISTAIIAMMLGMVVRELRLIRLRIGGHLGFTPFKED